MGFFDFLKNKPNTDKEDDIEIKDSGDMAMAFNKQMAKHDESVQTMLKEIDDTIAEIDRRIEEQEKDGKETRE